MFRQLNKQAGILLFLSMTMTMTISACASLEVSKGALESIRPERLKVTGELSSEKATDGSIVLVTVRFSDGMQEQAPTAKFDDIRIPFYPVSAKPGWYEAVLGIPYHHQPGLSKIVVSMKSEPLLELSLTIEDGNYPSEKLKVSKKMVSPPKTLMTRIVREQKEIKKIYEQLIEQKYWNGPFGLPIESPVTSIFGTKRLYNGQLNGFHGGLDLRASVGTPILAPAPGVVVMAKNLYYTGNTVFLNHGYGVITFYAHMSKLNVKLGQKIEARDLLGLSGKTGRVNGPHLHWQAMIHHVKVNPVALTKVMR